MPNKDNILVFSMAFPHASVGLHAFRHGMRGTFRDKNKLKNPFSSIGALFCKEGFL